MFANFAMAFYQKMFYTLTPPKIQILNASFVMITFTLSCKQVRNISNVMKNSEFYGAENVEMVLLNSSQQLLHNFDVGLRR